MPGKVTTERLSASAGPCGTPSSYLTVKELSESLHIKPATLYAWAAQGKIPCVKIHGLIRFRRDEIEQWLETLRNQRPNARGKPATRHKALDIDRLIASAKRNDYTSTWETRPWEKGG
ncbi:MAG: helix-turn-helix domain-containing protein [Nitrospiraceae bacterium]